MDTPKEQFVDFSDILAHLEKAAAEEGNVGAVVQNVHALMRAAELASTLEATLIVQWLRHTAAQVLFSGVSDAKLCDFGAQVLEMVADAIAADEHWSAISDEKETLQ